jgi:iron complex outermembrane receptor protein
MTGFTTMVDIARRRLARSSAALSGTFLLTSWVGTALAQETASAGTQPQNAAGGSVSLEEIVVTAQKRAENILEVPVPVTALQADVLEDAGQVRLQDYFSSIPGFSVSPSPGAGGQQMLTIRGITTGAFTNPTVAVTVDGVPYGSSTSFLGNVVPDIDPADLARVEVLRGPQGTLYGASSLGGLVNFVTVDPSAERISGNALAGVSGIYHGAQTGYNVHGSINVPISDDLAVLASGFTRQTPGYIDNPVLDINGVNEERISGGRLGALWRPSSSISLKVSALYQDDKGGSNDIDVVPGLGDLQQDYIPGIGYKRKTQAYSATLEGKVGNIELTSITGYNINSFHSTIDITSSLGSLTESLFGVPGTPLVTDGTTRKVTQELRANLPLGDKFEWLVGGFYTHENAPSVQEILAENPTTGVIVGDSYADTATTPSTYTEYAAFTDLTYRITDQFDVQVGGRESEIRQTIGPATSGGPIFGSGVQPQESPNANAFTYLVTPRFKISTDLMVYARLASGYRAGGANCATTCTGLSAGVPVQFSPDKTEDYELGLKGGFLDNRLTVDASVYYINWTDIQIAVDNPSGVTYKTNGSGAKSEGVELSTEARPLAGLKIAAWATFDDAVLTQAFPDNTTVSGDAGSRLPFTSRFSGNLSADQDFPLMDRVAGFVGATASYVGRRLGTFVDTPERQVYPDYTRIDLRAGLKYELWTVKFYATNVTDQRGILGGGAGDFPPFAFTYIQPRTLGMSVSYAF